MLVFLQSFTILKTMIVDKDRICLTGEGISAEEMKKFSKLLHLPLWPCTESPFLSLGAKKDMPILYVVIGNVSEERFKELLKLPIECIIDSGATKKSIVDFTNEQKRHKYPNSLSFLLTGPSVYKYDVAYIFTSALQIRRKFSDARRKAIHLAVHESLVNGLFHGNLQLSSSMRQDVVGFVSYIDLISRRLNTPRYAKRAVSICSVWNKARLEIKIKDEGMGYSLAQILKRSSTDADSKSGRGLQIIAHAVDSCTIDNYGKEITLSFLRENKKSTAVQNLVLTPDTINQTDISASKVLIIEDNKSNQALLAGLLTQIGIGHIEVASTGEEGLAKVNTFNPDLIILDIVLPKMDGYAVLLQLRQIDKTHKIPILIQTSTDTREARDRAFKAGASDFITKPINPLEFFTRVRVHLENKKLVEYLSTQLNQINDELKNSQKMQRSLLPQTTQLEQIRERMDIDIASFFSPSDRLGGDFWQIIELSEKKFGLFLCDFSGHGFSAALNTFRLHTLVFQLKNQVKNPSDFLRLLNLQLCQLLPRGQFATFFFCIFDTNAQTLSYAGAGSPPPFLKTRNGILLLSTQGLPLGISPQAKYDDYKIDFCPGDKLILYSDALIEECSQDGLRLGEEGLLSLLQTVFKYKDNRDAVSQLMQLFFKMLPPPPQDDITLVWVDALYPRGKKK